MDVKLDVEMAPQELNTIKIGTNENDMEISPAVESDANKEATCRKVNHQEGLDDLMARATRLLKVDEQQVNIIQCPSGKSKIQKVPALLRKNPKFYDEYCSPKMISFGPIHHRRENDDLQLGQQLKYLWAFCFIDEIASTEGKHQDNEDAKNFLHGTVRQHLRELRDQFSKDATQDYNDEELAQLLFVDGCALLYFMSNMYEDEDNKGNLDMLMIKFDQLCFIWRDIIMLENQIPMKLMQLLTTGFPSVLQKALFLYIRKDYPLNIILHLAIISLEPSHLLDFIRLFYATDKLELPAVERFPLRHRIRHRYKNIGDLSEAGIQVKASQTEWHDISFTSNLFRGQLTLPRIQINDVTPYLYHNLIAYEMCPDFSHNFEFCSYFSLMDSFIDDAEDVKVLRRAGVLHNLLGSDEEVAKLFNEAGCVLSTKHLNDYHKNRYAEVKDEIHAHYRSRWKTWFAQLRTTYFNTPWSFITFLAAVLALLLTSIQTWYAIHPKK